MLINVSNNKQGYNNNINYNNSNNNNNNINSNNNNNYNATATTTFPRITTQRVVIHDLKHDHPLTKLN